MNFCETEQNINDATRLDQPLQLHNCDALQYAKEISKKAAGEKA